MQHTGTFFLLLPAACAPVIAEDNDTHVALLQVEGHAPEPAVEDNHLSHTASNREVCGGRGRAGGASGKQGGRRIVNIARYADHAYSTVGGWLQWVAPPPPNRAGIAIIE